MLRFPKNKAVVEQIISDIGARSYHWKRSVLAKLSVFPFVATTCNNLILPTMQLTTGTYPSLSSPEVVWIFLAFFLYVKTWCNDEVCALPFGTGRLTGSSVFLSSASSHQNSLDLGRVLQRFLLKRARFDQFGWVNLDDLEFWWAYRNPYLIHFHGFASGHDACSECFRPSPRWELHARLVRLSYSPFTAPQVMFGAGQGTKTATSGKEWKI